MTYNELGIHTDVDALNAVKLLLKLIKNCGMTFRQVVVMPPDNPDATAGIQRALGYYGLMTADKKLIVAPEITYKEAVWLGLMINSGDEDEQAQTSKTPRPEPSPPEPVIRPLW